MKDSRIAKWAHVLVSFSLNAQRNQTAFLLGDPEAIPLVEAIYQKLVLSGVRVDCLINPRYFSEFLLKYGSDEQITFTPLSRLAGVENYDLYIYVAANSNSKILSQVLPKKQTLAAAGNKPITDAILQRSAEGALRWCYTMYPTPSAAQDAEMGSLEYEEFVLNACFLNHESPIIAWQAFEAQQNKMIQFLEQRKELLFKNSHGTDLKVNISHRKWMNCCGRINFPDGEIYTGPNYEIEGGVNGVVRYSLPTIYRNVEVQDIELYFENGIITQANASKNQAFLREMIAQDLGAKRVGEVALGTNYLIKNPTKNILFDEKIGGTFHLALGKSYPETECYNESALHWDIVFDMRQGGTIYADDFLIQKNGKFINEDWPQSTYL